MTLLTEINAGTALHGVTELNIEKSEQLVEAFKNQPPISPSYGRAMVIILSKPCTFREERYKRSREEDPLEKDYECIAKTAVGDNNINYCNGVNVTKERALYAIEECKHRAKDQKQAEEILKYFKHADDTDFFGV